MQDVPFYPSPAERGSRRAAIVAELSLDYGISVPPNASYKSIALPFQRILARLTRRDYVRLAGIAIGEHFDELAKEAHKQMRLEMPHNFISLVEDKRTLRFDSYAELLSFWAIYARLIARSPNLPAETLAGYILQLEDFKEILWVEAYIVVKKLQMMCHDFIEDMALLRQNAHKNKRGTTHVRYTLGYFATDLHIEEAFDVALFSNEISSLFAVSVSLPALCGQYKSVLEERLADFELACQHQQEAATATSALALHDMGNTARAFGKHQKLLQKVSVQASHLMRAGEAHIESHSSFFSGKMLYKTIYSVSLLAGVALLIWSVWAAMPLLAIIVFIALLFSNLK